MNFKTTVVVVLTAVWYFDIAEDILDVKQEEKKNKKASVQKLI